VEGHTYAQIVEWLKQMGHQLSPMALQRYSKDFLSRLDRLKQIRDQAKAIVESNQGAPGTQLAEAANEMALSMIMETLMAVDNPLADAKVTELLKALPKLADSATRREALKFQFNKGVEAAAARIKEELSKELKVQPELQQRMAELIEKAKIQAVEKR
jgi:hypothetical protein